MFQGQDLEEQKRTKYKINGTATTAIEKSNPNRPAKFLSYEYVTSTVLYSSRTHTNTTRIPCTFPLNQLVSPRIGDATVQ